MRKLLFLSIPILLIGCTDSSTADNPSTQISGHKPVVNNLLPIEGSIPSTRVESGHSYWMSAKYTISQDCTLTAIISTKSNEALAGFTGQALFLLRDDKRNLLQVLQSDSYGVNGTSIPGAPSSRNASWTGKLTPSACSNVSGLEAEFGYGGADFEARFEDLQKIIKGIGNIAG